MRRIKEGLCKELAAPGGGGDRFHDIRERCETIMGLLQSSTQLILPMFNNIVSDLFTACLNLVSHTRHFCLSVEAIYSRTPPAASLAQTAINLLPRTVIAAKKANMLHDILR